MSEPLRIFVSHSHQDDTFARALVAALRGAGADVWYDEHNMGSGRLGPEIERELRARPVFIVVLSPAALASRWVENESRWAFRLFDRDPTRTILPVLAVPIADEMDIWLFLQDFKRVEAPGVRPYPQEEAARRTLMALALTPRGEAPAPVAPQPSESAEELVTRGKALEAQGKHAEALSLLKRATQLAPDLFDAWFNLARLLRFTGATASDRLAAWERAVAIKPNDAPAWTGKGNALNDLKRSEEALAAQEQAITLDPSYAIAWNNKGNALRDLKRPEEALAAFERATTLDPSYADAWYNKGNALRDLKRPEEALAAFERATTLDPSDAMAWRNRAYTLIDLRRFADALSAAERAIALEPNNALGWTRKASALRGLGKTAEADAAAAKAKALGG
jgi:tetratricopeptide (TPR) repeat protein